MTNDFNAEVVLKEILAVLERYAVPVSTMVLDVSLLEEDFEVVFPQLKEYKAGVFYKSLAVNDIPATLRVKRRMPFGEIVQWLEQNVLPFVQNVAAEIEQRFEGITATVHTNRTENGVPNQYSYHISIECRLRDVAEIEFNTVMLSVGVTQYDGASYPMIYGHVGWLVDEESGGDFGIDLVTNLFPRKLEVHPGILDELKRSLPRLDRDLRREVERISKNQVP